MRVAWGIAYYAGLTACVFLIGGWCNLLADAKWAPPGTPTPRFPLGVWLAGSALLLGGWRLGATNRRTLAFGTMTWALLFPLTLLLAELLCRSAAPAWPALGLHGLTPEVATHAWSRVLDQPGAVGLNSWGQRDRERSRAPAAGMQRIAFIGDSFLEESAPIPVSLRVEQLLDRDDVEVINLGVSATGPDEYFERTRRIAVPLGATHIVVCIYAGNDFVETERTLPTYGGVAAVYPRGSFCASLGLLGVNHLFTNSQRPMIRAWTGSGDLFAQEEYRRQVLAQADDATIQRMLLGAVNPSGQEATRLSGRLAQPGMEKFYAMLRAPDAGLFRSYYLSEALSSAARGQTHWSDNSEESALHWIRCIADVCQQHAAGLTVVIIPEAFQVDSRMVEQWKPLTDMRYLTAPCRAAAKRFTDRAERAGIEVIDLHKSLHDQPGMYLNMDGHWSARGVERVAAELATQLASTGLSVD